MGGVVTLSVGRRGLTVAQSLLVSAGAAVFVLALATTLAEGAWRAGLLAGVFAACISSAAGIGGVVVTTGRPLNAVLLSRMLTFFLRMMLVGLGVLLCMRSVGDSASHVERMDRALAFVCSFFPLFFISTVVEHFTHPTRDLGGTVTPLAAGGTR